MKNINIVDGDLIELTKQREFDAVAHGCNCFHTMGAGIAHKLNNLTDGKLLKVDKATAYGDINKLGRYTLCASEINDNVVRFYNLYTQYTYGKVHKNEVYVHWGSVFESLVSCLTRMPINSRIGIPMIGCGLAGGNERDFIITMKKIEATEILDNRKIQLTVVRLP